MVDITKGVLCRIDEADAGDRPYRRSPGKSSKISPVKGLDKSLLVVKVHLILIIVEGFTLI